MKQFQLSALFICISICGYTQINCKNELDRTPSFILYGPGDTSALVKDLEILTHCGGLNSVELELITGGFMVRVLMKNAKEEKLLTYRDILDEFNEFQKEKEYEKIVELI